MKLALEDGTLLEGVSFGAANAVCGEVVFNTAMAGYVEALTDPSYRGQILVLTYPLVGSYGVPAPRRADTIAPPYESPRIQVQGLIVQNYVEAFSHRDAVRSLGNWLLAESIPAVQGIDTRRLTRRLRERGTLRGWLFPSSLSLEEARAGASVVDMRNEVFRQVAPAASVTYPGREPRLLLIDVGAKDNMVRALLARGATVRRVPWHEDWLGEARQADGVVIGNGPGDPSDLADLVRNVRVLLDQFHKPVFGICLGNQILGLAAGGSTYKLPYGHRGVNQPVQDLLTRRCYITSQNHGYAVNDKSLPEDWEPWFVNINDGTSEGIRSKARPHFGVQFHPEAKPGPEDTGFLFDEFIRLALSTSAR